MSDKQQGETLEPIYVASRASLPERGEMWRRFRAEGVRITSSWIDEDGEGQTADFGDLWLRIASEIRAASALVLYAEADDFPLKGALIEAGLALGMGKPVFVCLPDLGVLPRNYRPIGSWIAHPLVTRCDLIRKAVWLATRSRPVSAAPADESDKVLLAALRRVRPDQDDFWTFYQADPLMVKAADRIEELLRWLGTEQTMHAAWRKRAEECEADATTSSPAAASEGEQE